MKSLNAIASTLSPEPCQTVDEAIDRCHLLSKEELDLLPFGAIELGRDGTILHFNRAEGSLTGVRPGRVLGQNFFTDVAPCTRVQSFYGRFERGVREFELNERFPFTFEFASGKVEVWIRLYLSVHTGTCWVFVQRQERAETSHEAPPGVPTRLRG